jgi:predicted DNA-binding antitoxin AbrB/MazE fold protein
MKVKGIKRGQAIELLQELNLPDGQEVEIEIAEMTKQHTGNSLQNFILSNQPETEDNDLDKVFAEIQLEKDAEQAWRQKYWKHPKKFLTKEERKAKLDKIILSWKNDTELLEIFAEIEQERHTDMGRPDVSFYS